MNGTRISSTSNVTLETTGNGIVRLLPNQSIPANTTQQGIFGVCASRTGGNALPSTPSSARSTDPGPDFPGRVCPRRTSESHRRRRGVSFWMGWCRRPALQRFSAGAESGVFVQLLPRETEGERITLLSSAGGGGRGPAVSAGTLEGRGARRDRRWRAPSPWSEYQRMARSRLGRAPWMPGRRKFSAAVGSQARSMSALARR